MPVSRLCVTAAAVALLTACNSSQPQPTASATPTPTPLPTTIPAEFQGRWGLTADDCTAGKGKAEGLLTINPDTLQLSDSSATLQQTVEAFTGRFRGTFKFAGKGAARTTDEVLDLRNNGQTLVRHEFGDGAAPLPSTYMKCT